MRLCPMRRRVNILEMRLILQQEDDIHAQTVSLISLSLFAYVLVHDEHIDARIVG